MPENGIYLINSTGETVPLATEGGSGDTQLLWEAMEELDIPTPDLVECDVCDTLHPEDEVGQTCPDCGVGQMEVKDE